LSKTALASDARRDFCDDVVGCHHVRFGTFELPDLEADGDGAVDAGLREIDAAVGVYRLDKR
jgi:hypothetical protein